MPKPLLRLFHWSTRLNKHVELELPTFAGQVVDVSCPHCGGHVMTITGPDTPPPGPVIEAPPPLRVPGAALPDTWATLPATDLAAPPPGGVKAATVPASALISHPDVAPNALDPVRASTVPAPAAVDVGGVGGGSAETNKTAANPNTAADLSPAEPRRAEPSEAAATEPSPAESPAESPSATPAP